MNLENSRLRLRLSDIESQLLQMDNSEDDSPSNRRTTRQGTRMKQERKRELKRELMMEKTVIEDSLRLIIYPILTIPIEITSEIFLHCLPAIEAARPSAPLLLGRICRMWRDIAYSSPRLWAVLHVSSWWRTDWVKDWLRRAASAPLSLRLALSGTHCTFFKGYVCGCPSSVLFNDQWEHLISFYASGFTLAECITLFARAPRLIRCELLYISSFGSPLPPNTHVLHTEIKDLVLAKNTTFTDCALLLLDSLTLPNLRSLTFGTYRSDVFINDIFSSFVQRAPRIQTFTLSVSLITNHEAISSILDAMPSLTFFELASYSLDDSFAVLRRIGQSTAFLPQLKSLRFSVVQRVWDWEDSFTTILLDALTSRRDAKSGTTQLVDFQLLLPQYPTGKIGVKLSRGVAKLEEKDDGLTKARTQPSPFVLPLNGQNDLTSPEALAGLRNLRTTDPTLHAALTETAVMELPILDGTEEGAYTNREVYDDVISPSMSFGPADAAPPVLGRGRRKRVPTRRYEDAVWEEH
ncbi:hypothetical protein C8R45DRAFT_1215855 [Mycena sanguinolenta]|nr:hypothetical protein C8R45DRAFT_1215855 [Mycena sanguinolenta]